VSYKLFDIYIVLYMFWFQDELQGFLPMMLAAIAQNAQCMGDQMEDLLESDQSDIDDDVDDLLIIVISIIHIHIHIMY